MLSPDLCTSLFVERCLIQHPLFSTHYIGHITPQELA